MLCDTCRRMLRGEHGHARTYRDNGQIDYLQHKYIIQLKTCVERTKCFICRTVWDTLGDDEKRVLLHCETRDGTSPDHSTAVEATVDNSLRTVDHPVEVTITPNDMSPEARRFPSSRWFLKLRVRMNSHSRPGHVHFNELVRVSPVIRFVLESTGGECSQESRVGGSAAHVLRSGPEVAPACIHLSKSMNTGSPESMNLAKCWLEDCCSNHTTCNNIPSRNGWNPTRLLEIDQSESSLIRVKSTTDITSELAYFTLSHRWSNPQPVKLTQDSYTEFAQGFDLSRLPKTFRDAVHVTQLFGRRYLWIDSLCIIQDDYYQLDWQRESSRMELVYMYGDCNLSANLSAIGAADGADGLCHPRDVDLLYSEAELAASDQDASSLRHCRIARDEMLDGEIHHASLHKRGWVMQERVLSKRILYFGQQQVLWECSELEASETFPSGMGTFSPSHSVQRGFKAKTVLPEATTGTANQSGDRNGVLQLWNDLVESYSRCQLTVASDKLIAVSGIARRLAPALGKQYLWGLWQSCLPDCLFWKLHEFFPEGRPLQRGATGRGPTWSWASVDSAVAPGNLPGTKYVLKANYFLRVLGVPGVAGDDFGEITSVLPRLKLQGRLNSFVRLADKQVPEFHNRDDFFKFFSTGFAWDAEDDHLKHDFENRRLFYMPGRQCYDDNSGRHYYLQSLMLRCDDWIAGTFSRVGLHTTYDQDHISELLRHVEDEVKLPYTEWDVESRLHTITVI